VNNPHCNEIYFSTDVETNGPIPGPFSMLSLGSAAYRLRPDNTFVLLSTFSINFETMPYATEDTDTMNFWAKHPDAYAATRQQTETPVAAMRRFVAWIDEVVSSQSKDSDRKIRPVFVGYPAGFDFMFVYWYLIRFFHSSPFSFSALDAKTYAAAVLKTPYHRVGKREMPPHWFAAERPHTHVGIDDAIEQGEMFMRMLVEHLDTARSK